MASLNKDEKGYRIRVICPDGTRRSIRLGKGVRKKTAADTLERIEALRLAKEYQQLPDKLTNEWTRTIRQSSETAW
jgi:hypothetical protein